MKVSGTVTFRTWTRQDGTSVEEVELRASGFEREERSGLTEIPLLGDLFPSDLAQ